MQHTLAQLDMTDDINEGFTTFKLRQPGRYDMVIPDFVPNKNPTPKNKSKKDNTDINSGIKNSDNSGSGKNNNGSGSSNNIASSESDNSGSGSNSGSGDNIKGGLDFSFLNDKAPWLPLVKRLLGDKVTLIRIGCMLSLPGSEAQKWHSDGPHLHSTLQLPPHCLNVRFFMCINYMCRAQKTHMNISRQHFHNI